MNRSGRFKTIKVCGDPKYNSVTFHKIINKIMKHGHKQRAASIFYEVLEKVEKHYNEQSSGTDIKTDAIKIIDNVIHKLKPSVLLRKKKIASKIYRVPVDITEESATKKAIMWLVYGARIRTTEKTFIQKLFAEICDIVYNEKGEALKKKDNYHRIAKENEAFAHYV